MTYKANQIILCHAVWGVELTDEEIVSFRAETDVVGQGEK